MDIISAPENGVSSLESVATAMIRAAKESQRKRDSSYNMRGQKENTNDSPIYDVPVLSCEACELVCGNMDDLQYHRINSCSNTSSPEKNHSGDDENHKSTDESPHCNTHHSQQEDTNHDKSLVLRRY